MSPTRSPLADVLESLRQGLERVGARWYVFGAQAAILHGAARLTADVDVTVRLEGDPEALIDALAGSGLRLRVAPTEDFVRRTRVFPFVHAATGLPVDLVLAGPGLEEEFLQRASTIDVGGIRAPVIAAEDLVATKLLAGRAKDLEDAVAVLAARPRLDLALVRRTLRLLERVLDRSDLLPELERTLARARRRV